MVSVSQATPQVSLNNLLNAIAGVIALTAIHFAQTKEASDRNPGSSRALPHEDGCHSGLCILLESVAPKLSCYFCKSE